MPVELLTTLETSALAQALTSSPWAYPAVAAAHLLGVALLVGAIVPMDLRLFGLWSRMPTGPLIRVLIPTAAVGLAVALVTGVILFVPQASGLAASQPFQVKLALIGVAFLNILAVRINQRWRRLKRDWDTSDDFAPTPGTHLALAGVNSAVLWVAVLLLSRMWPMGPLP